MKTRKIVWILILVLLSGTTSMAQQRRNMHNRSAVNGYGSGICLNFITDLTEDQRDEIAGLVQLHQETMTQLRERQRSTFNFTEKHKIRQEMLQAVQTHRNQIRNVLTAEQQKQYEMMHCQNGFAGPRFGNENPGNQMHRNTGRFRGRGN